MPVARLEGWRVRAGTHAASALTSTYNVQDFPIQSDQNDASPWDIDSLGTTPPKYDRIVTNGDKSRSPDGFANWQWRMSYMTNGMLSYWLATLLPGEAESAEITALTYTATDAATYWTALISKPEFPSADAQVAIGGWNNVIWRFTRAVQIFP